MTPMSCIWQRQADVFDEIPQWRVSYTGNSSLQRAERRAAEFASIPGKFLCCGKLIQRSRFTPFVTTEVHVTTTVALLPAVNHNSIEYEE